MATILSHIMNSKSVAIIGVSNNPNKAASPILKNMLDFGFKGKVYPINPRLDSFMGLPVYASIRDIEGEIDLAIISTPPKTVPNILKECVEKRVKAAIINSEGFAEVGGEGENLQREVTNIVKSTGIRVLGPNTTGVVCPPTKLSTSIADLGEVVEGNVGFIAQSGLFAGGLLMHIAHFEYFGLSGAISLGNKVDIDESDALEFLADDDKTEVIALYLEGIKDGRRFIQTARMASARKPVVLVKGGRTSRGAEAALSHTASLASNNKIFEAALKQVGIIEADDFRDLIDTTRAFAFQPLPKGNRVAIVTNSGACGTVAIDFCIDHGLEIANFKPETTARLLDLLEEDSKVRNPVDTFPAAMKYGRAKVYEISLDAVLEDEGVDAAIVIVFLVGDMTPDCIIAPARRHPEKPVLVSSYGLLKDESKRTLNKARIPDYTFAEPAILALSRMYKYAAHKKGL
jgi:acyl-CoA synthetase (NDP forming)